MNNHEIIINKNKKNIFPLANFLFINYNTPITDLLAHPFKKTIIYIIIVIIVGLFLKYLNILKYILKIHKIRYYSIILLFIGISIYINQYNINKNIEYIVRKKRKIPSVHEYNPYNNITDYNILKIFYTILVTTLITKFISFNLKGFEYINSGISVRI